jgi:branched-chain amino acid transport system ATP-binding protein
VIVHGRIAFEGRSAEDLNNNELVRKFYLGL